MQEWQEIVKAALVGTARQGLPTFAPQGSIGLLLSQLTPADRERALLRAAGIMACCRRAGYRNAVITDALPAPASDEDRPRIAGGAMHDLDRMLAGEFEEALPEWLATVMAKGRRVPEETLPELLELGRRKPELQGAITGVIGQRGRWLAAWRPEWKYAVQHNLFASASPGDLVPDGATAEQRWRLGGRDERLALLEALRVSEPGRAHELVAATWAQDPAEDRALFLETFPCGLSIGDEPLLESALDDRRKEVRQQAAGLLARLPDSQLCRRMIARAEPLLNLVIADDGEATITVSLPEICDTAMVRDGVLPKPPPGIGERAWWLIQILSHVPLAFWTRNFGIPPPRIVAANRAKEWQENVLTGWTQALKRWPDPDWGEALLHAWIEARLGGLQTPELRWSELIPQPLLAFHVERLLRDRHAASVLESPIRELLAECREAWSVSLTLAVLANLSAGLNNTAGDRRYMVIGALERYSSYMAPAAIEEAWKLAERITADEPHIARRLEKYYALAQFRTEMMRRLED